MEGIVQVEVLIYGHDGGTGDYIASCEGNEVRVDLLSMDLVDPMEDDVNGRYIVSGELEDGVIIADKVTKVN